MKINNHLFKKKYKTKLQAVYFIVATLAVVFSCQNIAKAAEPEVLATNANLITRVAPGEFLPISVRLTNFGSKQRADVTISYRILDNTGTSLITNTETVAVQTTASFIKTIQ